MLLTVTDLPGQNQRWWPHCSRKGAMTTGADATLMLCIVAVVLVMVFVVRG